MTLSDALRREEYTGDNRCAPCTLVNVLLAAALAAVPFSLSPLLGVVAFAGAVGVVYLRGYLVPGTPALTRRYLPARVLARFGKDGGLDGAYGIDTGDDAADAAALVEAGALVADERGDGLRLADGFREEWAAHVDRLRDGEAAIALADALGVDPDRLSVTERGTPVTARVGGRMVGWWESDAAFAADVAAECALAERAEGWSSLPLERRSRFLSDLRLFLDRCPACGSRIAVRERTVESCCRSRTVLTGACRDCDARLFEVERGRFDGGAAASATG